MRQHRDPRRIQHGKPATTRYRRTRDAGRPVSPRRRAAPGCARADRPAQPHAASPTGQPRAPDLCASRPHDIGHRRAGCAGSGCIPDAIVGLQLANTVECVLTLLAVLRAGMIAMPLPLLWRRADISQLRSAASAPARLIVSGRDRRARPVRRCACRSRPKSSVSATSAVSGSSVPDGVVRAQRPVRSREARPAAAGRAERPLPAWSGGAPRRRHLGRRPRRC